MPHRVWAGPAVADMDGDGILDILIGDTLVSQGAADFAPLADQRGISFNPAEPDPGQQVTDYWAILEHRHHLKMRMTWMLSC